MGGILIGLMLIPVSMLIAGVVVRWMVNRPEPNDGRPVSAEDLYREKPESMVLDLSDEYLDAFLESVEDCVDFGFNARQRESLADRVANLGPGQVTYAMFPIQYAGTSSDLIMHFLRLEPDLIKCRFDAAPRIMHKIRRLADGLPQRRVF